MPTQKLKIKPDRQGYAFKYGLKPVEIALDGGPSRRRSDFVGNTTQISVQWVLKQNQYDYIMAFYRTGAGSGAKAFTIDLLLDDSTVTEYTAYFVAGSFGLTAQEGLIYTVGATLEVMGDLPDSVADQAIIDAYVEES